MNPAMAEDLEGKLTPAAQKALDELVDNYRAQVLLGAIQSASKITGDVEEVTIRDIVNGATQASGGDSNTDRLFASPLWLTVGISTVVLLITFLIFTIGQGEISNSTFVLSTLTTSLLAAGGLLIFGMFLFYRTRIKSVSLAVSERDYPVGNRAWLFLKQWQALELAMRDFVARRTGESTANKPISALLNQLRQSDVLTDSDAKALQEMLQFRNKIVHTRAEPLPDKSTLDALRKVADRLLVKLTLPS